MRVFHLQPKPPKLAGESSVADFEATFVVPEETSVAIAWSADFLVLSCTRGA